MKNLGQKPFKVNLVQEGDYNRLYIKHSSFKNRIRKHIGIRSEEEKENILFFLRYDLENHFANNEITREAVEEFIDQYINMQVRKKTSILSYFDEFIAYKKNSSNKKTRNKLVKTTITSYLTAGEYFRRYLEKKKLTGHPSEINKTVLDNFYHFIKGKHNYRVKLHTKVKAFIRFVEEVKRVNVDPTYKNSVYTEEYDNLEPEPDDIALTVQQVKRLIELKGQIASGEIDIEANDFTDKIPAELQELQFKMKRENLIHSLDCFLFMISFGMYHSDIQKSKISILSDGDFKFLKYRRAKNGSLCKSIPIESDGIFIGDQIIKEYKLSTGKNFPLNLSLTHFNKHLERISELAGFDFKLNNKMARKTFASILYFDRKLPVHLLQILLGHQNVKHTLHYLRIDDVDLASQVKQYMFPALNEQPVNA